MSVQKVDKTTGNTTLIAGATLYADSPIGTILAYGGATAPSGWMLCQGQELTKTDYAELYAVIGDSFGTASVNTKFVLPDLREATTKGVGLTGKSNTHYDADGLALGEYIDDRIKAHEHYLLVGNAQNAFAMNAGNNQEIIGYAFSSYGSANSKAELTGSNTNEVKAVGVNFIIKAKQVALPADLESAVEDAVEEVYGDIIPSSASSSNKVLVNSDKTSAVTSGSTAPITSGGVYDEFQKHGRTYVISANDTSPFTIGENHGGIIIAMQSNNTKHIIAFEVGWGGEIATYDLASDNIISVSYSNGILNIRNVTATVCLATIIAF